jgi:Na+/H+ antiporter NhaD/arsenite permease-like protein
MPSLVPTVCDATKTFLYTVASLIVENVCGMNSVTGNIENIMCRTENANELLAGTAGGHL